MLRLACLGSQFVGQLREQRLDDVEVVWLGTDAERFREEVPRLQPHAVVIDFAEMASETNLRATLDELKPELTIVTYDFARRKFLRDLQASAGARVLQSPVTIELLRAHLAPFALRHKLRPSEAPRPESPQREEMRFSREQLGRLMEIPSSIQCECPNHIAQLVEKLQAFELYSRDCQSRDAKDAQVHAALYATTQIARREMEKALALVIEHERIDLAS
ncbi:MAG: hypothetical protein AB1938_04885 [Myxococcota bacterium]